MRTSHRGFRARPFLLPAAIGAVGVSLLAALSQPQHGRALITTSAPVAFAQEQQPCGCPKMPVVATSDNPAKGRAEFETDLSELEKAFSNRYELYAGGWDDAMLAWAHELDPSGALKIWDRPAPVKKRDAPALEEGTITGTLLRISTPQDADPRTPGSPALKAEQDTGQISVRLFHTLARINKYGEPQAGLRSASLALLRFFAEKAPSVAYDVAQANPRARVLRTLGQDVRGLTGGYLAGGITDGDHLTNRDVRQTFTKGLALDSLDLANAALDVFWATDDVRREQTVRPTNEGTSGNLNNLMIELPSVASGWTAFGAKNEGPAQEAVSCRAYSVLLAMLDTRVQGSREARDLLFGDLQNALFNVWFGGTGGNAERVGLPEIRAYEHAVAAGGVGDEMEADQRVDALYGRGVGYSGTVDAQKTEAVRALRMLTTYAGGERETFRGYMADRVADHIAESQRRFREDNREPDAEYLAFMELWNSTQADKPLTGDFSCGPDEGESTGNIFLYAVTNHGLQQVLHPYVGVPMVIEAQYDPPEGATEKMLTVSIGGLTQPMTFKRFDPKGYIYRSEPFVPGVPGLKTVEAFDPAAPPKGGAGK